MKNAYEEDKSQLREEIDGVRNESNKDSSSLQSKLKDTDRMIKELTEKSKRDKNMLETENEKLEQSLNHMKEANEKLQVKNSFLT